jgi:hypothetical protein
VLRRLALELPNLSAVHRRALSSGAPAARPERALAVVLSLEHVFYMWPHQPCLTMLDEVFAHQSMESSRGWLPWA